MQADRLTERMHAVLDGTATPEQAEALRIALADDPALASEFATWAAVFDGLSRMPMAHPPEGLVAAIATAVPSVRERPAKLFSDPDQLYPGHAVLGSGKARTSQPFGFQAILGRLRTPAPTRESYAMNTNRKFLAGGVAAIVALGIAAVLVGAPPKSADTLGTVVPAERYRAPQAGAEAVKLGDQAGAPVTSGVVDNAAVTAGSVEAAARADKANAALSADKANAALTADKANAALTADKASAAMTADKASAAMTADKASAAMTADKASAAMTADKASAAMTADKASAAMTADKAAASMRADKANAAARADRANAAQRADKAATN
ncbi:MAG: hypothetical protein ABWZ85_06715 [Luteibacter sp.]